jgi:outer membrane protein
MKQLIFALVLVGGALALPAAAADKPQFGYVDLRKVVNESKAGKQARAEMEKLIKQRLEQIGREEKKLKEQLQTFEKEQLAMSEAQRKQKAKEFEEKFAGYQKLRVEAEQEVSKRESDFMRKILPELRTIITALAKEEKLALVFDKGNVPALYAEDGPDLTDKVMQRFEARGGK